MTMTLAVICFLILWLVSGILAVLVLMSGYYWICEPPGESLDWDVVGIFFLVLAAGPVSVLLIVAEEFQETR